MIHVYCMPGMAADPIIFEHLRLPKDQFKIHWLSWISPQKNERIEDYSERVAKNIKHKNVVLIGVSLGGIIVQEMKKFISVQKLILISTVKTQNELPKLMKLGKKTKLYKALPTRLAGHYKKLNKLPVGKKIKKRLKLYERYIGVDDKDYLDWGIQAILHWERKVPEPDIIHIHGDKDRMFPIKNIKNCIVVKGGTHIMIINRFRWFNDHLPRLITSEKT